MATLNLRPTLIGRRPAAASTRLSIEDIASGWRPGQSFFTPINYSRGALSTAPKSGHDIWIRRLPLLRSEEHTTELQSIMLNTYAVFCLNKKKIIDRMNKK